MNVFTFLQWLWLILLVGGVPLLIMRPIRLKSGKPITDRARSWLWFLQALGFWAIVIGGWMKLEAVIPQLMEPDEEEEAAEEDDEPADDDEKDDKKSDDDEEEQDPDEDDA